jgi:Fe-S cluster assembly protein SufD
VGTLAQAEQSRAALLQSALGAQNLHQSHGLAALNTASLRDAAVVHVPAKARLAEPLHIVYVQSGTSEQASVIQPRTLIVLEAQAQATVWEHYLGTSEHVTWTNGVTEVRLAQNAHLEHITGQNESRAAVHTTALSASIGPHAHLCAFAYSQGGASARREMHMHLDGEGAEVSLGGLYMADASEHHDFQVNVHHNKAHTQSAQNFRGILRERSTGVFSGTVYVAPGAAKTNARQLCRSLLLSAQARAHAQPRLEILTDDVKCAHGATVGELDDDALFYLQSRGLDKVQAQRLLTYAFAAEALADAPKSAYASLAQAVRTHMGLTDLGDSAC